MRKIDLGCGKSCTSGYIGVDIAKTQGVSIIADANKKLPFEDNSIDVYMLRHILEHVDDLKFTMEELYRTLKPDGLMHITVPHYQSQHAYSDFTHKRCFTEMSFRYFDGHYMKPYADYGVNCTFETIELFVHGLDSRRLWLYVTLKAKKNGELAKDYENNDVYMPEWWLHK